MMLACQVCGTKVAHSASGVYVECGRCFRTRLSSVRNGFTPTRKKGQIDPQATKRWEGRLDRYADARRQGVQPMTTKRRDIEQAMKFSDLMGEAFTARTEA